MGTKQYGIDPARLDQYTQEIKSVKELGIEIAIVIGGGNIFRGVQAEHLTIDRVQGDYMGMLATVMNGMALQSALGKSWTLHSFNVRNKYGAGLRTFYS